MVYNVRRSINLKGMKGWVTGVDYRKIKQALESIVGSVEPRNDRVVETPIKDVDGERFFNIGIDPSAPDKVGIEILREGFVGPPEYNDISDCRSYRFLGVASTSWEGSPSRTSSYRPSYEDTVKYVEHIRDELQRLLNS